MLRTKPWNEFVPFNSTRQGSTQVYDRFYNGFSDKLFNPHIPESGVAKLKELFHLYFLRNNTKWLWVGRLCIESIVSLRLSLSLVAGSNVPVSSTWILQCSWNAFSFRPYRITYYNFIVIKTKSNYEWMDPASTKFLL